VYSTVRVRHLATPMLLLAALLFPAPSSAQAQAVQARIDASKTGAPISRYLYGQFVEHIGGIVNNGIWAEMLDDRKFYFPITAHPPAEPPAGPSEMRRPPLRHWTPVGPEEFVTMDATAPYVSDHTPLVKLGAEAHGIQQAGMAVRKGRSYTGRVVLAGTPGALHCVAKEDHLERGVVGVGRGWRARRRGRGPTSAWG
jgi:alpha-L-arabinofuranosidase